MSARATRWRSVRLGLRAKLMLVSLALTVLPLVVVWGIGIYEDLSRRYTAGQLRDIGTALVTKVRQQRRGTLSRPSQRGWLADFAKENHVMIRLIDAKGAVAFRTRAVDAERWSHIQRGWFRRAGDFFFGPQGPPDLLAYERTLPPVGQRDEVRRARAGRAAETWRLARNMSVLYRALPAGGGGIVYLTRVSRRSVRALYDLRYQLLKLTLILAAIAALMGLWVGWRFVNPLVRIQRTIGAYLRDPAAGIDPEQLALRRNDEIGDLSRDLQRLAAAMKQQLARTAEMAADLAHDLKNPIATVSATSELLETSEAIDADRQARLSRAMRDASDHMNRSVEGMLALARLDQSLASAGRSAVHLSALLSTLIETYRSDPAAERVVFETSIADGVYLDGIADQLEVLIRNLLDNAIVFCSGTIAVSLRCHRDEQTNKEAIELQVNDDGPGISTGNQQKLFRRFFSARPEGAAPGTGLGLAIAETICRSHGGQISVEPGELAGANFVVRLPL